MSRALVTASVEIFHDQASGRLATENVMDGLGVVAAIAGRLDVVRDRRLLKISQPDATEVTAAAIRWPQFETDFALVLTDRPIHMDKAESEFVEGHRLATAGVTVYGGRVAIVNTTSLNVTNVVAHEVGHIFGLKSKGDTVDTNHPQHCRDACCLMHWGQKAVAEKTPITSATKTGRLFERMGLIESYQLKRVAPRQNFCGECSGELEMTGKLRALAKQGIHVPRLGS